MAIPFSQPYVRTMHRIATLILLAGCTTKEGDTGSKAQGNGCSAGSTPQIEVGHGELSFSEFSDGANTEVELVHGPQGGFHSTIAVRAQFLDLDTSYHIRMVGTIDGVETGWGTPYAQFRCNHQVGAQEYTGGLLIWDAQPEDLHGKNAVASIAVIDPFQETADGDPVTVAQASAEYTIWDPTLEN